MCSDDSNELCTWGDGDSLDRERVRDIYLKSTTTNLLESNYANSSNL